MTRTAGVKQRERYRGHGGCYWQGSLGSLCSRAVGSLGFGTCYLRRMGILSSDVGRYEKIVVVDNGGDEGLEKVG